MGSLGFLWAQLGETGFAGGWCRWQLQEVLLCFSTGRWTPLALRAAPVTGLGSRSVFPGAATSGGGDSWRQDGSQSTTVGAATGSTARRRGEGHESLQFPILGQFRDVFPGLRRHAGGFCRFAMPGIGHLVCAGVAHSWFSRLIQFICLFSGSFLRSKLRFVYWNCLLFEWQIGLPTKSSGSTDLPLNNPHFRFYLKADWPV